MTETRVWENDVHPIAWRVTSTAGAIDLTGATVRLVAKPLGTGGAVVVLASSVAVDVVTHQLDGTLPPGQYDLVIEVTRAGEIITYPDAATAPERLVVRADVG
jgi:hypothetical protein